MSIQASTGMSCGLGTVASNTPEKDPVSPCVWPPRHDRRRCEDAHGDVAELEVIGGRQEPERCHAHQDPVGSAKPPRGHGHTGDHGPDPQCQPSCDGRAFGDQGGRHREGSSQRRVEIPRVTSEDSGRQVTRRAEVPDGVHGPGARRNRCRDHGPSNPEYTSDSEQPEPRRILDGPAEQADARGVTPPNPGGTACRPRRPHRLEVRQEVQPAPGVHHVRMPLTTTRRAATNGGWLVAVPSKRGQVPRPGVTARHPRARSSSARQ